MIAAVSEPHHLALALPVPLCQHIEQSRLIAEIERPACPRRAQAPIVR
jgi:hypothetical protein